jgi:alanyl-tRNA synthetase
MRALSDYRRRIKLMEASYQQLNCKEEELPEKIALQIDENKQLKYRICDIQSQILNDRIETIAPDLTDVTLFTQEVDAKAMRNGVNLLVERYPGLCAIFSGNDDTGYNFVIGSRTRDCAAITNGLRELLGAKGGGSKQMAQGNIPATRAQIEGVL